MSHHSHRLLRMILGTALGEHRDKLEWDLGGRVLSLEGEKHEWLRETAQDLGNAGERYPSPGGEWCDTRKDDGAGTSAGTQPPEYQPQTWGMPAPLSGTDGVVSGVLKTSAWYGTWRKFGQSDFPIIGRRWPYWQWVQCWRCDGWKETWRKYRESKTPTVESIHAIDYSRRLELFETACKVFAIPNGGQARVEPHKILPIGFERHWHHGYTLWRRITWRSNQKEYRQFLAEIGPGFFKRPLLTHRNAITTGWKRVGRVSRDNTKARESILEEDLAKNVSLSLHNSFCLNRESKVKGLPIQPKKLQEQRKWMRSYEQLKAWEDIVISSDDEEALLRQFTVTNASGRSTSRARITKWAGSSVSDSWVLRGKKRGLSVNADEIWSHGKEILMHQSFVINMLYLLYESKSCMTIYWLDKKKEVLFFSLQSGNLGCRCMLFLMLFSDNVTIAWLWVLGCR